MRFEVPPAAKLRVGTFKIICGPFIQIPTAHGVKFSVLIPGPSLVFLIHDIQFEYFINNWLTLINLACSLNVYFLDYNLNCDGFFSIRIEIRLRGLVVNHVLYFWEHGTAIENVIVDWIMKLYGFSFSHNKENVRVENLSYNSISSVHDHPGRYLSVSLTLLFTF